MKGAGLALILAPELAVNLSNQREEVGAEF